MSVVLSIFLYVLVFLIVFPFVLTIIVYGVNKSFGVHPLKSFHRSMAWSTFFYILAVTQMLSMFFERLFIGIIACLLLLTLSVIIISQRRKESDVQLKKASRLLWRICFLFFILLYIVLVIYGVVIRL